MAEAGVEVGEGDGKRHGLGLLWVEVGEGHGKRHGLGLAKVVGSAAGSNTTAIGGNTEAGRNLRINAAGRRRERRTRMKVEIWVADPRPAKPR